MLAVRAPPCVSHSRGRGQVPDKLGADLRNSLRRLARWSHHELLSTSCTSISPRTRSCRPSVAVWNVGHPETQHEFSAIDNGQV